MLVFVPKSANESKIVKEKWAASIAVATLAFICYRSLALFFVEEKKRPLFWLPILLLDFPIICYNNAHIIT